MKNLTARAATSSDREANLWLGFQIRTLRLSKGLSIKELALRASLSVGMVSQLERGLASPSIRSLRLISQALDVQPGHFFQEGGPPPAEEIGRIVRSKSQRVLHLSSTGVSKQMLTPETPGLLQITLVRMQPEGSSGPEAYTHRGEDAGYVIAGSMELWVGEDRHLLEAGDSFRFKSSLPHKFGNPSSDVTEVLWVVTPPFY
jgi:transcriptional regulator with XRE-family HTH domain